MKYQRHQIINFIVALVVILASSIIIVISVLLKNQLESQVAGEITDSFEPEQPPRHLRPPIPAFDSLVARTKTDFIDLQPVVDQWLKTVSPAARVGLMIYDLTNSKVAASFQANQVFEVASVYKLLFAYDGYHQIALGSNNGEDFYTHTTDKGDLTLYQCLDLTIRESYNGCADKLASDTTRRSRVNVLIHELGMNNTSKIGLESTASDLTKLLRYYWRHDNLTPELWERLADSMLYQPPTQVDEEKLYDWRQGLPAGFSEQVKVYDKVGWAWNAENQIWDVYAEAAILEFVNSKHVYTMVALTQNLPHYSKISELGRMVETTVLKAEK